MNLAIRLSMATGVLVVAASVASPAFAQQPVVAPPPAPVAAPAPPAAAVGVELPPGYTIGPDDVLNVMFWRDKDMTVDVVVRPDGRITLPLVNDVMAQGLTPEQLRDRIRAQASQFVEEPSVTVVVKQINSRKVFITGMVGKPGGYQMTTAITVLQLISIAGGLDEFANPKKIVIMRLEDGRQTALRFNYNDVRKGKNLHQNIALKPGDTVVVP